MVPKLSLRILLCAEYSVKLRREKRDHYPDMHTYIITRDLLVSDFSIIGIWFQLDLRYDDDNILHRTFICCSIWCIVDIDLAIHTNVFYLAIVEPIFIISKIKYYIVTVLCFYDLLERTETLHQLELRHYLFSKLK